MKRILYLFVAFVLGISAFAEDFNLYYLSTTDNQDTKIEAVENIQKVVFEDGVIKVIYKDNTTKEIQTSLVKRLFFFTDNGLVAIDDVKSGSVKPGKEDGEIYDFMGRRINAKVSELPKGFYIVNGKKLLKK